MTTRPASPDEIVRRLQGKGVTQGWDVVYALSAHKINELFQRRFVLDLLNGDHLPPVTGTVPVIGDYAVEFGDVVLGHPLITFDPERDPQAARLTIPVISGIARTTVTSAGATTVVDAQWITAAHGYTITGTVPLGKVKGEVEHQTHIGLRFEDGKDFFAGLGTTDAAGTLLGTYFGGLLAGYRRYSLGTLDYTPNPTGLTPAGEFEMATQRDLTDPGDAGRLLLFIPTTYNQKGGTQTTLPMANLVPAGMDATLLVSSKVMFGGIVRDLVAGVLGEDLVAARGDASDAWSTSIIGGSVSMPVAYTSEYGAVQAGWCGKPEEVYLTLKDITLGSTSGWLTAKWSHQWTQPWSVEAGVPPLPPICDQGQVTMTISLNTVYRPAVDPVTATISFTADTGIDVTFPQPEASAFPKIDIFKEEEAREVTCRLIAEEVTARLGGLLDFTVQDIGAFAVTNLLFPGQQTSRLQVARVPGDLVAFGTLQAPDLAVAPPLSSLTTAETLRLTAGRPVTWSVPRGGGHIDADGLYTPPTSVSRSTVVVITATAQDPIVVGDAVREPRRTDQRAYAAVVITPAQIQVTPIISVVEARDQAKRFTARLPGSTEKATWSISPAVGSVNDAGDYTPPARIGEPTAVTITARVGERTGSARIVVFPASPAAVQVTPYAPAPLGPGARQAFTAALGGDPVRAGWSLLPDVGAIDRDGVYTAPERVTAPQAVLVVARHPDTPVLGGTAVVLLTPDGDDAAAVMRPRSDGLPTERTDGIS
ncbi:hypothetical protein GCM10022226_43810 [Sphaerisporangium flaviroseum]|uniref:Uncharacterized protein n=1 Tax=Sphaerisporangium flaviroseum TaxID=509199 RepID=A0ABP7IHF9_9ACTN